MADSNDRNEPKPGEPRPQDQSPPGALPPEDVQNLTGQIEQLIRQRNFILERLQLHAPKPQPTPPAAPPAPPAPTAAPAVPPASVAPVPPQPATAPSGEDTLKRHLLELEAENRELRHHLERQAKALPPPPAPVEPGVTKAELQNFQNQNAVLRARIARLETVKEAFDLLKASSEERIAGLQNEVGQLKTQLQEKDRATDHLKVRLADAMLEQNAIQVEVNAARQELEGRLQEFSRIQAEHAALTVRVEEAGKNEQILLGEVKRLGEELSKLREDLVESRISREGLEKELDKRTVEMHQAQELAKRNTDQAVNADHFKHQMEAAEARERELVETFNALQRERNRLQERLSRLLIGVDQYISGPPVPLESQEIHEPREFGPYLPFCFPDSLPRSLRLSWKRTPAPRLPMPAHASPAQLPTRARRASHHFLQMRPSLPQNLQLLKVPFLEMSSESLFEPRVPRAPVEIGVEQEAFAEFSGDEHLLPRTARQGQRSYALHALSLPAPAQLYLPPKPLSMLTWSTDLYLGFLFSTISRQRELHSRFLDFQAPRKAPPEVTERDLPSQGSDENILRQRLAYRPLSHLKFARLFVQRDRFVPEFQRNRLKTVFKSFGDSISSMTSRLEQMLQDPSGKKDAQPTTPKRTGPQEDQ